MATITTINVGAAPNDGSGDQLRTAFETVNTNFGEVNSEVSGISAGTGTVAREYTPADALGDTGDLKGQVAYDAFYVYVCSADYDGSTPIWIRTAIVAW